MTESLQHLTAGFKIAPCKALAGGEAEEALTVLTGWPCETILFEQEEFDPDILWATMCTSRDVS